MFGCLGEDGFGLVAPVAFAVVGGALPAVASGHAGDASLLVEQVGDGCEAPCHVEDAEDGVLGGGGRFDGEAEAEGVEGAEHARGKGRGFGRDCAFGMPGGYEGRDVVALLGLPRIGLLVPEGFPADLADHAACMDRVADLDWFPVAVQPDRGVARRSAGHEGEPVAVIGRPFAQHLGLGGPTRDLCLRHRLPPCHPFNRPLI